MKKTHTKTETKKRTAKKMAAKKSHGAEKPIGTVLHFYRKIKVAVIKFNKNVKVGTAVEFRGATTHFKDRLSSFEYDHHAMQVAKKGRQVGAKVARRVREGDGVYQIT